MILLATRRNQAIHDLVTRSTVQIRDLAKASPGQYVTERTDLADPGMPPWWRRLVVIFGYVSLTLIAMGVVTVNAMSAGCLEETSLCSTSERIFNATVSVGFLFLTALIVGLGWKGRLFGARLARRSA